MDQKEIWEKLHFKAAYDDVRFRKLCSDLLKLVEGFLAQQVFDETPLRQADFLIKAVGDRKLEKLYKTSIRTARRLVDSEYYKDAYFYLNQYQFEKRFFEVSQVEQKDRSKKLNVEAIMNHLDSFYIAEKLRYYCSILSRQNVVSHEYKVLFIDEIVDFLKHQSVSEVPSIAIYYQIYLTHTDSENEEHYYLLKKLLERHGDEFPRSEAKVIYTYTINYCIAKINQGVNEFLKEFLDINEDLLKKGILTDGELSPWKFQNIVTVALRAGRYKWTEDFIKTYKDDLPIDFRENALSYNQARLYWYQKHYDKVISMLREVEYEDVSYNLGSKSMLLLTYYETEEIEPLYSLLDSFRVYLNRHKDIPANRRKNYLNLIKFTKKLTKIIPGDQKAIQKLTSEIDQSSGIMNEEWLREKITELS